jgi:hypothetical protein
MNLKDKYYTIANFIWWWFVYKPECIFKKVVLGKDLDKEMSKQNHSWFCYRNREALSKTTQEDEKEIESLIDQL